MHEGRNPPRLVGHSLGARTSPNSRTTSRDFDRGAIHWFSYGNTVGTKRFSDW